MKKKSVVLVIVALIIMVALFTIIRNISINKPGEIITSVRELSIIDGYDDKNFMVISETMDYKIIYMESNKTFSVIDNSYNILENNSEVLFKFMKKYNNLPSNYYYSFDLSILTIKYTGQVKFEIDLSGYIKNDFNIVDVYEPVDNNILIVLFTDNKWIYLIYNNQTKKISSIESDKLLQMINLNNEHYYAIYNNKLISLRDFKELGEKYNNPLLNENIKYKSETFTVISSNKYVPIKENSKYNIVDITKDGKKVTQKGYNEIIAISSNNKYFEDNNNNKYNLYDINENRVLESQDFLKILDKFIVSLNNDIFTIYDLNMNKIKEIKYDLNYEVNAFGSENTVILSYKNNNIIKNYAMYNVTTDKVYKGDVIMLIKNDIVAGVYKNNDKTELLYNNFKDSVVTNNKDLFESKSIDIIRISEDNKKYCMQAINDNNKLYFTVLLDENKVYKVNHFDCVNFNTKPKIEYDLNNITLKNNGNITKKKITNIEQVNDKYFKVTYDDNSWLYEYVK